MPGEETQEKKQNRRIACLRCRQRKKRCDHALPTCGECITSSASCTRIEVRKPKISVTALVAHIMRLESRIAQLEQTTGQAQPEPPALIDNSFSTEELVEGPLQIVGLDCPKTMGAPQQTSNSLVVQSRQPATSRPECGVATYASDLTNSIETEPEGSSIGGSSVFSSNNQFMTNQSDCHFHLLMEGCGNPMDDYNGDSGIIPASEVYFKLFFEHVHPEWPFLDKETLQGWFSVWRNYGTLPQRYQAFFLRLVCATGALFCSSWESGCPHLARSRSLYARAIDIDLSYAFSRNLAIRAQASLLIIVYTLHSPKLNTFDKNLITAVAICGNVIKDSDLWRSVSLEDAITCVGRADLDQSSVEALRASLFITCYATHEVACTTWNQPEPEIFPQVSDNMTNFSGNVYSVEDNHTQRAIEHVFSLRCTWTKIRQVRGVPQLQSSVEAQQNLRFALRSELDDWKRVSQYVAVEGDRSTNHLPETMIHLYGLSVCMLAIEDISSLTRDGTAALLDAVSRTCRSFRKIRESRAMVYWSWSALISQFRVGITLLYCYWATPLQDRARVFESSLAILAVEDCFFTLSSFAQRWKDAQIYCDLFQLLVKHTNFMKNGQDQAPHRSPQLYAKMRWFLQKLRERNTPYNVTSLIATMAFGA